MTRPKSLSGDWQGLQENLVLSFAVLVILDEVQCSVLTKIRDKPGEAHETSISCIMKVSVVFDASWSSHRHREKPWSKWISGFNIHLETSLNGSNEGSNKRNKLDAEVSWLADIPHRRLDFIALGRHQDVPLNAAQLIIAPYLTASIGYMPLIGIQEHDGPGERRRKRILNKFKFNRSTTLSVFFLGFAFHSKYGNRRPAQLNISPRFLCVSRRQFTRGVTSSGSNCTHKRWPSASRSSQWGESYRRHPISVHCLSI